MNLRQHVIGTQSVYTALLTRSTMQNKVGICWFLVFLFIYQSFLPGIYFSLNTQHSACILKNFSLTVGSG